MVDVVCLGVHILDVLGRPVTEIPPGQGGIRIEEIRITAAGTAAGTAVDLAKLGASVACIGCVGTDELGDVLLGMLVRHGINTEGIVRTSQAQTSATILPIRPNGDRPALHVVGANAYLRPEDVTGTSLPSARHVHLGGVDAMGAFVRAGAPEALAAARRAGATTSLDLLSARPSTAGDALRALLPGVDWLLPNAEQLCDLYGLDDPVAAAHAALADGAGGVVVSRGAQGCSVVLHDAVVDLPAFDVSIVDTTGCGDAVSAGFIEGLLQGRGPVEAARLGLAAAALVAGGLGSDAGIVDLASTEAAERDLPVLAG